VNRSLGQERLSVVLPTVRAWPEIEETLAATLRQECSEPYEVLVVDGHGAGLPCEPEPPVRWIREPGADVFRLRAVGAVAARGEVVVFSEDHCVAQPDWLERLSAAHRDRPAPVLVGPVRNHPESSRRAVDRASFALTLGPFAPPLDALPEWRLPVPTNLAIERSALPAETPPSGWLEYDFLAEAQRRDQLAIAANAVLEHLQSWPIHLAVAVHFQSGRSYGASVREWPRSERRGWWRALPTTPRRLFRSTAPALGRIPGRGRAPLADRFWLALLVWANVTGQFVGALAGPGASRSWIG
jgi:hypothetical protein